MQPPPIPPGGLAELHRHLDGSLRPATVEELARERGVAVPEALAFQPGMGLQQALARFAFTLSLLQRPEEVRRVAHEMCEDASLEGTTTLEIRFAPQLHRQASPGAVIDAALDGIAGRAGLVLCGLYGEDPSVLSALVELAASRPGVVGIDLAGGPLPDHVWRLEDYAPAFARARDLGLGRTVHAGEGRPPGEIRRAIELLDVQRIGHGTSLLDDRSVAELVLDRGVTIEACISSNWHVGAIPSPHHHPLPRWLEAGVRACICTDNTLLSAVDGPAELAVAAAIPGMGSTQLARAVQHGHDAAFPRTRALLGRR
jgi:adenosine deaminase